MVVENIGNNHFFANKNVVTVFDDMVTTMRKAQKMNEYLYEIAYGKFTITDLSDEEIIYVVANEELHVNRKKKIKSRSICCKGDLVEKRTINSKLNLYPR